MVREKQKKNELTPEGWSEPKKILVILAHPDDPEFFCGATLARWADHGHHIRYCLFTRGDKGTDDRTMTAQDLMAIREREQLAAATRLGVEGVRYLDYPDGYLLPTLEARKEIVRVIREEKPDVIVTSDPTNLYPNDVRINHPDHRAAGQIVLDAIFPAARNHNFFPELLTEEGLEPHPVNEIWISLTHQPTVELDVTAYWDRKMEALHEHVSQIGDPEKFDERMRSRHTTDSTLEKPRYEEKFRRLNLG